MKAVIMAGGQGTRFWPVSREHRPKQFLQIAGEQTMLAETVSRLQPLLDLEDCYVVCSTRYVPEVRSQISGLQEDQIIVEHLPRSTAACIGLAAGYLKQRFPDEVMAALPADHVIEDTAEFHRVLGAAETLAKEGWLVTFGIQPSYPACGYGYLLRGEPIGEFNEQTAYQVAQFTEKPDQAQAEKFLSQGSYFWNSGMFVWSVEKILSEIEVHMPDLSRALEEIGRDWDNRERTHEIFARLASTPVDYGVMEKSSRVAMLPCRLGWNDVGNWKSLEEIRARDRHGVAANNRVVNVGSQDCILWTSEGKLGALVGVKDLVIVDTPDALLICSRDRTEDVKQVVESIRDKDWKKYL